MAYDDPDLEYLYAKAVNSILFGQDDELIREDDSDEDSAEDFGHDLRMEAANSEQPHGRAVALTSSTGAPSIGPGEPSPSPNLVELNTPSTGLASTLTDGVCAEGASVPASDAPLWSQSTDPSLRLGWKLRKAAATIHLPPSVADRLPELVSVIETSVSNLYDMGTRPTLPLIRVQLKKLSVDEEGLQSLLPVAARHPFRFMVWFPADANISVLLADRPHKGIFMEQSTDPVEYSPFFLNGLCERWLQSTGVRLLVSTAALVPMCHTPEHPPSWQPSMWIEQRNCEEKNQAHRPKIFLRLDEHIPVNPTSKGQTTGTALPKQLPPCEHALDPASLTPVALADKLVAEGVTTLIVRFLPQTMTKKLLVQELAQEGFDKLCDCLHMSSSFDTGVGKGCAVIRFSSLEAMSWFVCTWHGSTRFLPSGGDLPLSVSRVDAQGLDRNAQKKHTSRMPRVRKPCEGSGGAK